MMSKCGISFNACGTSFFMFSISFSDRKRWVALTELSHTFNNCSISVNNNSSSISVAKAANYKYYNCTSKEELSLSPLYLKKSSAEIELDKKLNKG